MVGKCIKKIILFLLITVLTTTIIFGFISLLRQNELCTTEYKAEELSILKVGKCIGNQEIAPLQVVYKNLSSCRHKPIYFSQHKAHCWEEDFSNTTCNRQQRHQPTYSLFDTKETNIFFCIPNLNLLGMRKSGTTDFSYWFKDRKDIGFTNKDVTGSTSLCPVEYFKNFFHGIYNSSTLGKHAYIDGPGILVSYEIVSMNLTHLVIASGAQFLGYMATPETRYYIQLRNPTDRTISYFFHWFKLKYIFENCTLDQMKEDFTDQLMQMSVNYLKSCDRQYGELGCSYQIPGKDGDLRGLVAHSRYVIYIEETLKFINRMQVTFATLDEYSQEECQFIAELSLNFFGVDCITKPELIGKSIEGTKNAVSESTLKLLDNYFAPYNNRLANLLKDDKWLFKKRRK